MGTLEKAIAIAAEAHAGQADKAGRPYIAHPLRMVVRALEREMHPDVAIVAALHDVIEDSDWSRVMLRRKGFTDDVLDAVEALTKRPGESYAAAVTRAAANPLARAVKALDVEDNSAPERLSLLHDDALAARLTAKYRQASAILAAP